MHGILVFSCLFSITLAASLQGGYNYQPTATQNKQAQAIYSKQFFIHSAPEESLTAENFLPKNSAPVKKNLRVLLIKSPESNGLTDAALSLAKQESASQTVVYVLNKQTDVAELQDKLEKLNQVEPNKPVVYFIKYRTPQEADFATNSIQSNYDSLTGTSQVSDEGVAPVLSFIGSADSSNVPSSSQFGYSHQASGASPSITNSYLPSLQ